MAETGVKVVILGAGGLVGARMSQTLVEMEQFPVSATQSEPLKEIVLFDMRPMTELPEVVLNDPRVVQKVGDMCDKAVIEEAFSPNGATSVSVIHLAAVLSGYAEDDFDLGMKVNFYGTLDILDCLREIGQTLGKPQKYVFASSDYVNCFNTTNREAPTNEESFRLSSASYGIQKACMELMICDYSRKGFVDGRVGRLCNVIGRPVYSNVVSYISTAIFTQPLEGKDYGVAIPMDVKYPISCLDNNVNCFLYLAGALEGSRMDTPDYCNRVIQLPGISVTLEEIWEAAQEAAKEEEVPIGTIHHIEPEEGATSIKTMLICPHVDCSKARDLGLPMDVDLKQIIKRYINRYIKK